MVKLFVPTAEDLPAGFAFTVEGVEVVGSNTDPLFNLCCQELLSMVARETWGRMLAGKYLVEDDEFYDARKRLIQFKKSDYELLKIRQTLWGASRESFTEREALYAIYVGFIIPASSYKDLMNDSLTVKDEDGLIPVEVLTKISGFSRDIRALGVALRASHCLLFGQFFTAEEFKGFTDAGIKAKRVALLLRMGFRDAHDVMENGMNIPREWLEDIEDVRVGN